MALRVLLADENVTIKKVIQLSLQDYAVSVKSVNLGIDVLEVARSFQPDIVLADVLLQKKNGYDVCSDFKKDSKLSKIPFALMWSSFMELDRQRFSDCQADAELEKPFDKAAIRNLVQQLVKKTSEQSLSNHLNMIDPPPMEVHKPSHDSISVGAPEDLEETKSELTTIDKVNITEAQNKQNEPPAVINMPAPNHASQAHENTGEIPPPPSSSEEESWNMDSFDEIEDFVQAPLGALNDTPALHETPSEEIATPIAPNIPPPTIPPPTPAPSTSSPVEEPQIPTQAPQSSQKPTGHSQSQPSAETAESINPEGLAEFRLGFSIEDSETMNVSDELRQQFNFDNYDEDVPTSVFLKEDDTETTEIESELSRTSIEVDDTQPVRQYTEAELETILSAQSKELIESVVWKIVPDLAERIIREELEKIMKGKV